MTIPEKLMSDDDRACMEETPGIRRQAAAPRKL